MDATSVSSAPGDKEAAAELSEPEERDAALKEKAKSVTAGRVMRRFSSFLLTALGRSLDLFDICIKILGPIFMCLALGLISFETYVYFTFVVPGMGDDNLVMKAPLTFLGVFLLMNLVYNYLKAAFTNPGTPPEWNSETMVELGHESKLLEEGSEKIVSRRCNKCNRQKPVRAHHCSVCKRCVLKMDHHCPWINNCVGFQNYRFFCLFLTYLALCCGFVLIVFLEAFLDTMVHPRRSKYTFSQRQCISLCWIIATCILIALCLLGGFHVYLLLTNQTTIEFHTNLSNKDKARRRGEFFRNPYDLGRPRNFKQVFGPHDFCTFRWALSFLSQPPIGDGMSYPSTHFAKA